MILNGPRRLGVSLAFGWGSFRWDASSQTCSWRWNCDGGGPFWLATLLSARMASARFLVIVCIRDSTRALWVCNTLSELSVGLYPKRIWLGDSPVVVLIRLLCTVVASASQCVHPLGSFEVTSRRYCSIHWFFRSDSSSVWGWNAVDKFCWMPSFSVSALPNCKVNLGSRSLIILFGSPNHR